MNDSKQAGDFWSTFVQNYIACYNSNVCIYNSIWRKFVCIFVYAFHSLRCYNWLLGQRIGEASHPGPDPAEDFVVCAHNVASMNLILQEQRLRDLPEQLCIFAETAATAETQDRLVKAASALRRHTVMTPPSPPRHFSDGRICPSKGQADGVAIVSRCPLRGAMELLPRELQESRRVTQTVAHTECGPVLFIGIYGYHQGLPEGMARTDELLRTVASRADRLGLPTVILGDLNFTPDTLDVWPDMRQAGWTDAAELQSSADGQDMQMTFRETSRIDVVLFNDKARPAFRTYSVTAG